MFHFLVQALTLIRLPLAGGVLLATILLAPSQYLIVALICLVLIETSDVLDGFLARRLKTTSELGEMLDPYADSVSRFTFYFALTLGDYTLLIVPYTMFIRDITVAYSRIRFAERRITVSAKLSGKAKAWVQGVGALILVVDPLYNPGFNPDPIVVQIVSWIVVIVTASSAIEYVSAALDV